MELCFTKRHNYLVCLDSDGTVFENMELKQKECFCPAFINVWGLQAFSRYAREVWEYVNLYSLSRGINRFPAAVEALELLANRKQALERGYVCPDLTRLKYWTEHAPSLSRDSLLAEIEKYPTDKALNKALLWTDTVNAALKATVKNIPPLPGAVRALDALGPFCDIVIVSTAPHGRLREEWASYGIDTKASFIAGQEYGTKEICIRQAMAWGNYDAGHVMKIGDAPADWEAAKANGVLFSPIVPGREEESWERILKYDIPLFETERYAEEMPLRVGEFLRMLSAPPYWAD